MFYAVQRCISGCRILSGNLEKSVVDFQLFAVISRGAKLKGSEEIVVGRSSKSNQAFQNL